MRLATGRDQAASQAHCKTPESASDIRDDGTHELKHARNVMVVNLKTLAFSALSEFLAGRTPAQWRSISAPKARLSPASTCPMIVLSSSGVISSMHSRADSKKGCDAS